MAQSLEALVEAARGGDRLAFSSLVDRFQDMAVGSAYARLGDVELARDAAQESLTDAFLKLDQLREPRAFGSWLGRIVVKHCDRIHRRKAVETVDIDRVAEPSADSTAADAGMDQQREQTRVRDVVEVLPEPERIVVALYYLADERVVDIAEFLGIPLGTVKKRLFTARRKIEGEMTAMWERDLKEHLQGHLQEHSLAAGRSHRSRALADRVEIFLAVRANDLDAVRVLLERDAALANATEDWDIGELGVSDLPPPNRATPLIRAAERGFGPMVELLLDHGADADGDCGCDVREPALWAAVVSGRIEIARILLERNADPNAAICSGATALHAAAIKGNVEAVELLLLHGADRGAKAANGRTPLEWARANRHETVAVMLSESAAPVRSELESDRANDSNDAAEIDESRLLNTGIAAIDCVAPLVQGSVVQVRGAVGLGRNVLLAELAHNLARQGGRSVWASWPKHAWEDSEIDHLIAETGIEPDVELVQCRAEDPEPARREVASVSMERAIGLAETGTCPIALVWFIAEGHRTDIERLYPELPALAARGITTFIVDPLTLDSEGLRPLAPPFDAVISFDSRLHAIQHWPAIDPVVSHSTSVATGGLPADHCAAAADAKALLASLRELDPRLMARDLSEFEPADRETVRRARALQSFFRQPFFVAEAFNGRPGVALTVAEAIQGARDAMQDPSSA